LETKSEQHGEQPLTVEREILKVNVKNASIERLTDEVVSEEHIELRVNNERYAVFSTYPSQTKELVVGHLLTEGIIDRTEEIELLEISRGVAHAHLTKKSKRRISDKPRLILSACGGTGKVPPRLWMKSRRVKDTSSFRLNPEIILRAVEALNVQASVFRRTGGTHASVLLDKTGRVVAFSEDIGRHNAIDKVVGKAALESIDFQRTMLASTGRLTSEMVLKAAQIGIPIVVSMAAPTDKGIKIAETANLTLIGFARGGRFNIYTNPERIEIDSMNSENRA